MQRQNGCLPPENEVRDATSQPADHSHETIPGRISTGSIRSQICLLLVTGGCSHVKHLQPQHLDPVLSALSRISRGRMSNHSGNLPLHGLPVPRVCLRHDHNRNIIQDPNPRGHRQILPPDHNRILTFHNQANPPDLAQPLMVLRPRLHPPHSTSSWLWLLRI